MDAFKEEIEIGSSVESLLGLLDSQKELFHSQIDQLQEVVIKQCKLTGVNPLAQEMAAGALSIKIGKRPRDLLNPKAVKYMQAVFSIKDAISKKESREISALFGITVTQVRDFFVSQRMRVRKQVRLSREKVIRSENHDEQHCRLPESHNAVVPTDSDPLKSAPTSALAASLDPVPLNAMIPSSHGEALANMSQNDIPPDSSDACRHFTENIFPMMCKEETFSGQVKLMEWILQIQDSSVLIWFLLKGGVMILTTWLSQAASEEQTSVLALIIKVLCHLPLHKASPENMSAILQSVNGLRFYRTTDISNRARVLLSRWTKLFAKIQAMKKQNGINSNVDAQSQMLLKQSIVEIMGDDSDPEEFLSASNENSENNRKLESSESPKLLLASADDSAKKHMLGPSSSYKRERRKVQLVEQPGQKPAGRNFQLSRTVTANKSRPMSADDIQKAKTRALYMQSKYGKKDPSSSVNGESKTVIPDKLSSIQLGSKDSPISRNDEARTGGHNEPSVVQPVNSSILNLPLKIDEHKKPPSSSQTNSSKLESLLDLKQKIDSHTILKNEKRTQIAWHVPPEIKLDDIWRVAAGGSSKEVDVQRNRNRREKETVYKSLQEIPLNPKEPWDREMDFDDSLTPEILTEQLSEERVEEPQNSLNERRNFAVSATTSSSQSSGLQPDLELLAVLLKNPELVFALTSGKSGNLSSQDMVKLLDMIKSGGSSLEGSSMESSRKVEERVEVSLPSPTPSTNAGTSGWRPEAIRNPFSRQTPIGVSTGGGGRGAQVPVASMLWQAAERSIPHLVPSVYSSPVLPQTANIMADKHQHHSIVSTPLMEQQPIPLQMPVRLPAKFHPNPHLQQPVSSNSQIHAPMYPNREPIGNIGTISDSRRSQHSRNIYYSGQGNIATFGGGPSQAHPPGSQYVNNTGFESWSPENSPRSISYAHRQELLRQQSSEGYWDGDRRWRR